MKKTNKNLKKNFKLTILGFTLVELLAVIVILAVILVIAVPKVISVIEDSKKSTFKTTVQTIISAAEQQYVQNKVLGNTKEIMCEDVVKLNNVDYEYCIVEFDDGNAQVTLEGKGKFDDMAVCNGTKNNTTITNTCATDAECFTYEEEVIYEIKDYNSCVSYLRPLFVEQYGMSESELEGICMGDGFLYYSTNEFIQNQVKWYYLTEQELVENNVITVGKSITLTEYSPYCEKKVIIPKIINGGKVKKIGAGMATSCPGFSCSSSPGLKLTSVVVPEGIEEIHEGAFAYNQITSVKLPSSLTTIGSDAFSDNQIGGELDLSNTKLTTIEVRAFDSNKITSVKLPTSITTIGGSAFANNQISGELDLSNTKLTTIGDYAFRGNQITSVKLPSSLTTIGSSAFSDNQLTSLTIPNSVITIGECAFNSNLLPDNQAYIYKRTDLNNDGIAEIDTTTLLGYGGKNKDIIIPSSITTIEVRAFDSNKITSVKLPSSLTTIGSSAFRGNQLTSVKLPTSITTIGGSAFANNQISEELDLSNTKLTTIGDYAFMGNQITSVKLPSSLTTIGSSAFVNNQISEELDLSESTNITTIGDYAFSDNQITSVKLPSSLTTIGSYAFFDNQINGKLDLSESTKITTIGSSAFSDNQITSVELPSSVTTIESHAFSRNQISGELDLSGLTKLTTIGNYAFYINQLTNVKLPTSITTIGTYAFNKNSSSNPDLTTIINPSGNIFNWCNIIGVCKGTSCKFSTGTCTGDITVSAS